MNPLRLLKNITQCHGWSFSCVACATHPSVVRVGEKVRFQVAIRNDGLRIGTVYPIITLADPYDRKKIIFSSHGDLTETARRALRLVDIQRGEVRHCWVEWTIPSSLTPTTYYLQCEIWNPPRLFGEKDPQARLWAYRFHKSDWRAALEVVPEEAVRDAATMPQVFISYAGFSEDHIRWLVALRDQLVKRGIDVILAETDLRSPMEITLFMERGLRECDAVILVCSDAYVQKANQRIGGVGYETVITTKMYYDSGPDERRWIPILRDNTLPSGACIPTYLGMTMWIDMRGTTWDARPLADLTRAVKEVAKR